MKKRISLPEGEIVTTWAETPEGPGWSNRLVWVLIRQPGGGLVEHAIQPEDQTDQMRVLFSVCAAATAEMVGWVKAAARTTKGTAP